MDFVENDPLKWGQLCAAQRPKVRYRAQVKYIHTVLRTWRSSEWRLACPNR